MLPAAEGPRLALHSRLFADEAPTASPIADARRGRPAI